MGKTKRNLIYQTLYQMLTLVLPFVTAPYISRVLGTENTGIYSYTYRLIIPAVVICLIVLSLHLFGDGLRDALDPKLNA